MINTRQTYNVLVLNGGGIKGLKELIVLNFIEKRLGGDLLKHFDLIAGTSTGGIIAACLAKGMKTDEIMNLYLVHGPKIFDKRFLYKLRKPMYNDEYVNKVLNEYFGDMLFQDLKCDVLIPAYNIQSREFVFFKRNNWTKTCRVQDGVRATMSAQVYFKPHLINGVPYIDGGNGLNNPSEAALKEARKLADDREINVLNLGTGKIEKPINPNAGKLRWLLEMPDMLMTEAEQLVRSSMTYEFDNAHPNENLGKYLFCDAVVQHSSTDMDDASEKNLKNLIRDGHLSYQKVTEELTNFLAWIKKSNIVENNSDELMEAVEKKKFKVDLEKGLRAAQIARSYIGQEEIPKNQGFVNKTFQKLMMAVGFRKGDPWCGHFARLVWKEAGLYHLMVSPSSAILRKASAMDELKPFWVTEPVPGAVAVYRRYSKSKAQATGHIAIVEKVEGFSFTTIDGNTSATKLSREGTVVDDKVHESYDLDADIWRRSNGLRLMGFYLPIVEDK